MTPRAFLLVLLSIVAVPVAAQDVGGFERVLIPVYGSAEGANGSSFRAWFTMYSEQSLQLYPSAASDAVDGVSTIAPGFPVTLPPRPGMAPRVLFVEATEPVYFNAHVVGTDAEGEFRDQITTIPAVRESEFRTGRSFIPGVPFLFIFDPPDGVQRSAIPQLRHTLRIYDVDAVGGAEVRVAMTPEGNPSFPPVREFTVKLDRRDGSTPSDPFYAQIPIETLCIPFSQHTPCTNVSVRYQLEPVGSFRYWAMVSTTDNVTQHVAVFSF